MKTLKLPDVPVPAEGWDRCVAVMRAFSLDDPIVVLCGREAAVDLLGLIAAAPGDLPPSLDALLKGLRATLSDPVWFQH